MIKTNMMLRMPESWPGNHNSPVPVEHGLHLSLHVSLSLFLLFARLLPSRYTLCLSLVNCKARFTGFSERRKVEDSDIDSDSDSGSTSSVAE